MSRARKGLKLGKQSEEHRAKSVVAFLGRKHSDSTKDLISKSGKGKTKSETHRKNLSLAKRGKKLGPQSPEFIAKRLEARRNGKGWTYSVETREKLSKASKGKRTGKRSAEFCKKMSLLKKGKTRVVSEAGKIKLREAASRRIKKKHGPFKNTGIERKLQAELLSRGIKFETEKNILGFRVDIYLEDYRIVVEADGCFHHCCPDCKPNTPEKYVTKRRTIDNKRNTTLKSAGYEIYRFWEHDINRSPSICVDKIILIRS